MAQVAEPAAQARQRLADLSRELLAGRQFILASNRGPITYQARERRLDAERGVGGVVTTLSALARYIPLTWISCTMTEGDRRALRRSRGGHIRSPFEGDENLYLRFVRPPHRVYHKYYNIFCNPLLWFLQHYMWNSPYTPSVGHVVQDAWANGYVAVNEMFAQAVVAEVGEGLHSPFIMLQDYHLYMAAGFIRPFLPNALIHHFIHIPWPTPAYWQLLPSSIREPIYRSLLSCDVVGLQTRRDVLNFLQCCETLVPEAEVDYRDQLVQLQDHVTIVRAYPISVDTGELSDLVNSEDVKSYAKRLASIYGEQTIVRVDRAEPSKNILRGFQAYDLLLRKHPEFMGRVKLLAFLVPSRTQIPEYRRYVREIHRLVERLNQSHGWEGWRPIELFYEDNRAQAIAAMQQYDVLLVNAVIDGMNLVAKEGPTVNRRNGVLVLSETTGAYDELAPGVLPVAPADLEGTAQAMHQALTMPARERQERARFLRETIARQDLVSWVVQQMEDLHRLTQGHLV